MKHLLCVLSFLNLVACMSTRISLSPEWNPSLKPSFEDYVDYYWFGLKGDPVLNLDKICLQKKPLGFKRLKSVEDGFITAVTLGIYTPATVRVWCEE